MFISATLFALFLFFGMPVVFGNREPVGIKLPGGDFGNELQPRLEVFPQRQVDQGFDRFVDAAVSEE